MEMEKGVSRRGKSKSTRARAGEDHGSSDEAIRGAPRGDDVTRTRDV